MGKPGAAVYAAAIEMLGKQPAELVAVGDSLQHDIAGDKAIPAELQHSCTALMIRHQTTRSGSPALGLTTCRLTTQLTLPCLSAGACEANIASVLIGNGIHAAELAPQTDSQLPEEALRRLTARYKCMPTYYMPELYS